MKATATSIEAFDAGRRAFLRTLTTTTAALVAGCGGGSSSDGGGTVASNTPPGPGPGAANVAPVWTTIPTVGFTQGVASSFSLASFVNDANGDALAISMNAVILPAGVTFDAAGKRLVYDGIGAAASVGGVQLTADDGRP
jgi:hypothetical protein